MPLLNITPKIAPADIEKLSNTFAKQIPVEFKFNSEDSKEMAEVMGKAIGQAFTGLGDTWQRNGGEASTVLGSLKQGLLNPSDKTVKQLGKNASKFLPEAFAPVMPAMQAGIFKLSLVGASALSLPVIVGGIRDYLSHNNMMLHLAEQAKSRNRLLTYAGLGTMGAIWAAGSRYSAVQTKVANTVADSQIRAEAGKILELLKGAIETIDPAKVKAATFSDVIGQADGKEKFEDIRHLVANSKEFAPYLKPGEYLVTPTILTGPAGVGKTEIVRALVGELNASGTSAEMIQFHCDKLSFKDSGASAIKALGETIRQSPHKNVVVFMDEMESIGTRNDAKGGAQTIPSLLTLMNGVTGIPDKNIVWLGATNLYEKLDDAITSRFTGKIPFSLPNRQEIQQLYKLYVKKRELEPKGNIDWTQAYKTSEALGFSGRDIQGVISLVKERNLVKMTPEQLRAREPITFSQADLDKAIQEMARKKASQSNSPFVIQEG